MNQTSNNHEDPRSAEILAIILKFAAGDLAARGTIVGDGSALDGVMAGINSLGEALETQESNLRLAKELAERTAAEQELHSANEQFSVLLDSLPIAVYRCAAEGDYAVEYMSQNVVSFTGYTARNFMDQSDLWFSRIHPDDAQRVSDEVKLLLEKGRHVYEYRWRKADGKYLWIRDSLRLVRFEDDTPNYLVGMWQDITEDKLAAEALRKANDDLSLFRKLLDSSSEAIEVIDPQTMRFLDVNETACRVLGYSREELLAMSVHDIDPNSGTDTFRIMEEKMRKSGTARFESTHRRKDGSTFPVEVNMGAVTLDRLYGLSIVHDISEGKQAALALRQSEEKFRALVESTSDWIWEVDRDGIYTYVSPRVEVLLGYKPEEVLGKTPFDFMLPDEVQHVGKIFGEAIAKRVPLVALENTNLHKDGRMVVLQTSGVPFYDDNGEFFGYRGIDRDVTESKQVEEKIRRLNDELEARVQKRTQQLLDAQEELVRKEKLALLGQVAGSVGHELRNPLAVMNNAVYFLQTVLTDADETTREYLEIIKVEIDDADRIVSDLLDSVRTKPPQPTVVNVGELIDQTLHKVNVPAAITVTRDIPETLPPVRVDARQIQQVFRNLIGNAVEAMPEGGTLAIRAVENRPEGSVTVIVRDSGSGIAPEMLAKLFQPLFTTKASGIGLGLVVVKNLIQANGGSIGVESVPGEGSRFFVTLPSEEGNKS